MIASPRYMARDKIQMPSGIGGLVRYFDEYKSRIQIKPGHVLIMIVLVTIIMIILTINQFSLLGF